MTTELYHYGIKGMKWGVRRYENKDGTLTPAGKKRYNYEDHQKKQDERLYGKRAPKRIQKRLDNGETLLSARNAEVKRRDRKKKIKQNLRVAGALSTLAAVTASPIFLAMIADKVESKKNEKKVTQFKQDLDDISRRIILSKKDPKRLKQEDNIYKLLNRTPDEAKKAAAKRQQFVDKFSKMLENSEKREADNKSNFEKKMKEYWENSGRDKWEKKNRKGGH